jgi:glycosyltransferase involved in cell wall biosynthesis
MALDNSQILMVIPLFNHGRTIRRVVEKARAAGWPVLVVDDGSTDGGAGRIADLDCQVIRLPRNLGKGAAILAGAAHAHGQGFAAIITVDADGQLDPSEAGKLAAAAFGTWPAIIIGARQMDKDNAPEASLFGRAFSNFWIRLECGRELSDTQSGYRLYPVEELLALVTSCRRYDFEVEILTRAAWAGLPILTVPVSVYYPAADQRESHFHQLKDNFRLTCLHTRLVCRALWPWPHKILHARPRQKIIAERRERWALLHPVRFVKRLCREHSSTLQLASAAWMGIFLGALPLIACHTVVLIYVCHRLHLNKLTAVTASQLCMPPLVPVLCIQIGFFMRHGRFLLDLNWQTLVVQVPQRLWEWLLGSLLLGPLLGLLVGGLLYFSIKNLRGDQRGPCDVVEKG